MDGAFNEAMTTAAMAPASSWLVTTMVWIAGLCSWTATLMSLAAVWSHCKNYSQPNLQRWVIRIIMMVPIYALTAWYSLVSVSSAYYLDTVRDIYEAFVIYCFVSLLIAYFGGERAFLVAMHDRNPTNLFWPASLVRKDLDLSDPYDYLFLKRGILQYVVVKPVLAASTMALKSLGAYHEGDWSLSDGYLWTQLVYNCSVSLSLYCLVVFYMATRESLAQWNPLPKFMCVKAIVFFSYWQGLGLSILVGLGLIHDTPAFSAEHIAAFLQSWLICLEMIGGAIGHWISFSYLDYVPLSRIAGRLRLFYAIRDAMGLKDVVIDAKSAWSGHQYTYKYFDPAVPADELDRSMPRPSRVLQPDPEAVSLISSPSSTSLASASGSQARDRANNPTTSADVVTFEDAVTESRDHPPLSASSEPTSSYISPIKERRLRAGMRYTQGGKKTYWLPVDPVDHRAVAFASAGAGRTRAKLLHGAHGVGSSTRAAVEYIGSTIHTHSRATHESRKLHKHMMSESAGAPSSGSSYGAIDSGGGGGYRNSSPLYSGSADGLLDELADISMDFAPDERLADDAMYSEARSVEGDFNYPVMEIGVMFGYARRRPYGNTLPRSNLSSGNSTTGSNSRPRITQGYFDDSPV